MWRVCNIFDPNILSVAPGIQRCIELKYLNVNSFCHFICVKWNGYTGSYGLNMNIDCCYSKWHGQWICFGKFWYIVYGLAIRGPRKIRGLSPSGSQTIHYRPKFPEVNLLPMNIFCHKLQNCWTKFFPKVH